MKNLSTSTDYELVELYENGNDKAFDEISEIRELLNQLLYSQSANYDSSKHEPIMLQLNGRQIAQAVWDETEKRYKQTGRYSFS